MKRLLLFFFLIVTTRTAFGMKNLKFHCSYNEITERYRIALRHGLRKEKLCTLHQIQRQTELLFLFFWSDGVYENNWVITKKRKPLPWEKPLLGKILKKFQEQKIQEATWECRWNRLPTTKPSFSCLWKKLKKTRYTAQTKIKKD